MHLDKTMPVTCALLRMMAAGADMGEAMTAIAACHPQTEQTKER
jgi:hypothetical protein